jgi:hypothetical protein
LESGALPNADAFATVKVIFQVAAGFSHSRDWKDVFEDIVEKVARARLRCQLATYHPEPRRSHRQVISELVRYHLDQVAATRLLHQVSHTFKQLATTSGEISVRLANAVDRCGGLLNSPPPHQPKPTQPSRRTLLGLL